MIHYNSPDHSKQRMEVVPPSIQDMNAIASLLNELYLDGHISIGQSEGIQRLIWAYENYEHASQTQPNWVSVDVALPEEGTSVLTYPNYIIMQFGVDEDGGLHGCFTDYDENWDKWREQHPLFWQPLPNPPKAE